VIVFGDSGDVVVFVVILVTCHLWAVRVGRVEKMLAIHKQQSNIMRRLNFFPSPRAAVFLLNGERSSKVAKIATEVFFRCKKWAAPTLSMLAVDVLLMSTSPSSISLESAALSALPHFFVCIAEAAAEL
jgi:hypothetical protein